MKFFGLILLVSTVVSAGPLYRRRSSQCAPSNGDGSFVSGPHHGGGGHNGGWHSSWSWSWTSTGVEEQPEPTSTAEPETTSEASNPETTSTPEPETTKTVEPTTTPKPRPTTTTKEAEPSPTGGSGSGDADADEFLAAHNDFRANHGADPLTWSTELASKAQEWADKCDFKHSGGALGSFGENLAAGTGDYSITAGVKGWTDESSDYDASNPQYSHFTQVVWKSSTELGCAYSMCDGIFDASYGKAKFIVCEYNPAGNVIGQFDDNVQA